MQKNPSLLSFNAQQVEWPMYLLAYQSITYHLRKEQLTKYKLCPCLLALQKNYRKLFPLKNTFCIVLSFLQLNVSTTASLGTEEKGHCREVAVVERLKQEWIYGLSAKKKAVVERWPLVEVRLYLIEISIGNSMICSGI